MSPKKIAPKDTQSTLNAFLAALRKDHRPLTLETYARDLHAFADWFEQTNGYALTPATLTATDVSQYRDWLARHKAAAATVNRKLAALRAFGTWARNAGLIETNPADGITGAKKQKTSPKWLDRLEQAALLREVEKATQNGTALQKVRGMRDRALIFILLHAGLRVAELCALDLGDVKLGDRKGALRVRHGKGNKERDVPLNAKVREAVRAWQLKRPKAAETARLFTGLGSGQSLKVRMVQRLLAEYGRRAKLEHLTPHILRHTCAKNLVDKGVPLDQVAAILGHESLDTTKIYTAPSESDLQAAVDRTA
jgi:integrase/recombinase XerC